jgi:PPP family 3-phenylpropionic acid transporter
MNADLDCATKRRDLWLTRLYYFALLGGMGFISPFLNIFYVRLGLSGTQIGWVAAAGAAVTLFAAPFWASRNDKWRNPQGMLQVFLMFTALGYLWLSQQTLFLGVMLVGIFRALAGAGISPLSDSLALTVTHAARKGFGSVRVWGSLGWVVFVLFSGWLNQQTSLKAGLVGGSLSIFMGAIILFPISKQNFFSPPAHGEQTTPLKKVIDNLLHNRGMVGVGLMIIIIGTANSGVLQFEMVYLDSLGAKESLIGIAGMLGAVVEIPCMFWADRLVSQKGAYRLLLAAMLLTAALRAMVLLIPAILTIMAERATGGIAFSFYVVALTRFIGEQTSGHETRTVMALYTVTLSSIIGIIAPPLAGAAYDFFGARWLYAVAAMGYSLGWLSLKWAQQPVGHPKRAGFIPPGE